VGLDSGSVALVNTGPEKTVPQHWEASVAELLQQTGFRILVSRGLGLHAEANNILSSVVGVAVEGPLEEHNAQ